MPRLRPDVIENRKGYSCWSKDDPGCGFVIWKQKAGKTLPPAVVKELMENGRTEKPVAGFKGRSGRTFRAKLKLDQSDDGKWRVEFRRGVGEEPRRREAEAPAERRRRGRKPKSPSRPRRRARAAASE